MMHGSDREATNDAAAAGAAVPDAPGAAAVALATTPPPPYWAVIFTNHLHDEREYAQVAQRMEALAARAPGFLGMDSVRGRDRTAITVSYWRSEADIRAWRDDAEHRAARQLGRERFYAAFELRVAEVRRAHGFRRTGAAGERPATAHGDGVAGVADARE